jgi:hypothetical protein
MNTKNPFQLAEQKDIKLREARAFLRENPEYSLGWGRVELHPHIISRRHVQWNKWPAEDYQRLHEHRKLHDEGKVTMCQGRDGDWIIQYAIPNNPPVKRAAYFFCGDYY